MTVVPNTNGDLPASSNGALIFVEPIDAPPIAKMSTKYQMRKGLMSRVQLAP
jgi:hypothetical protein